MAVDEALLEVCHQPTLRFYSWQPAALSLGCFQQARTVDFAACQRHAIDVVRRPTGGRAILHAQELTYSIMLPPQHPLTKVSVAESYRVLSGGLLRGLAILGLRAELARPSAGFQADHSERQDEEGLGAACFDAPSWYELTVNGYKVVGSAQVRRRGALLQHGSIPLVLEPIRLYGLLRFRNERNRERAVAHFSQSAAGLAQLVQRELSGQQVASALVQGWQEALKVRITPGSLIDQELQVASRLEDKHGSEAWVVQRRWEEPES